MSEHDIKAWRESAARQFGRPPVVCLCGSGKFMPEFQLWNARLTLLGEIVLGPGIFGPTDIEGRRITAEQKEELDDLHLWKIDLADYVLVINRGGYIGESTRREIVYAQMSDKPIYYTHSDFEETT